jgi:hypothetical protein
MDPETRERTAELPYPGASISLRLECCYTDLPARVLDADANRVSISAPVHLCRRPEIGMRFSAVWEHKTGMARSGGVVESQSRLPRNWVLQLAQPIEPLLIEKRYADDSPATLIVDGTRVPARVVDRSENGVGCMVPALVKLEPGQRVRVTVGNHDRAGAVARVRPLGNQLRVGIRLDELA